jgi:hypothetical protein
MLQSLILGTPVYGIIWSIQKYTPAYIGVQNPSSCEIKLLFIAENKKEGVTDSWQIKMTEKFLNILFMYLII